MESTSAWGQAATLRSTAPLTSTPPWPGISISPEPPVLYFSGETPIEETLQ